MTIQELKNQLENSTNNELKYIVSQLYQKIPEVKDYLDIILPNDKKEVEKNTESLLTKYKKQLSEYLCPEIMDDKFPDEVRAEKLIQKISIKDFSPKFTIECKLHFINKGTEFIKEYGYFDEGYYIKLDEIFESVCIDIKKHSLIENYQSNLNYFIHFGNEYGLDFEDIYNSLKMY